MKEIAVFFDHESDYPDLDTAACAERLGAAIRCKTVNNGVDYTPFDEIHRLIRESFPHVMAYGTVEIIGHSMLITLPGTAAFLRPALFMAHLDVVTVVKGTENDWTYPAFSGAVAEGYIWGRGALDIKNQVFGELEAAEYLLSHGRCPQRTIYLAFGEDEETFNTGARAISNHLKAQGVALEFVLDEGVSKIESGEDYGAPEVAVSPIGLMEKGYADLELSVKSAGGHSSCPFGGTSLGKLAKAIAAIVDAPFPAGLSPLLRQTFLAIAPYVTEEPLKTWVQDVDAHQGDLVQYCMSRRNLFPQATTTAAPTVITGSSASCNVMPQNMEAVINFRIAYGQSPEDIMAHCETAVGNSEISLRFLQSNGHSSIARIDSYGYQRLCAALRRYQRDVVFLPATVVAATDAKHYEKVCDVCLRCSPFMVSAEELTRGVHGTNERLSVRSYLQGIRTLIWLMEDTCF